jgi:dipeptidyl aminopeptidase/acylaminoacyl peptidase
VRVVSLNYRGSTGYGASFERARGGHAKRIEDVVAARGALIARFGEGPIFLFGHSYGALLAADVMAAHGDLFAGAILISHPGGGRRQPSRHARSILAFHPENDAVISPANAERRLRAQFGELPRGSFTVLPREGHSPHRLESWARVYAEALELIEDGAT